MDKLYRDEVESISGLLSEIRLVCSSITITVKLFQIRKKQSERFAILIINSTYILV